MEYWKNGILETRVIPAFQHSIPDKSGKMHKNHSLETTVKEKAQIIPDKYRGYSRVKELYTHQEINTT